MMSPSLLRLAAILLTGVVAVATSAQATAKVSVVGRLNPFFATDPSQVANLAAFRDGMRALGHVEGRTYVLEARFAGGNVERLKPLAQELVRLKPDVILAAGYLAVRSLKDATGTIPIVMATYSGDPVRAGLVASLARPGGNVTGIAGLLEELNVKQLELLRACVPSLTKVTVMYDSGLFTAERLRGAVAAGTALGLDVRLAGVAMRADLPTAFESVRAAKSRGLVVLPGPLMAGSRGIIAAFALSERLPSIFTFRLFAEAGGLMSYAHDLRESHRRSAMYVDRILKGANPAELPVERPIKFELTVNLKTAKALGLTVPRSILLRADEVIE